MYGIHWGEIEFVENPPREVLKNNRGKHSEIRDRLWREYLSELTPEGIWVKIPVAPQNAEKLRRSLTGMAKTYHIRITTRVVKRNSEVSDVWAQRRAKGVTNANQE